MTLVVMVVVIDADAAGDGGVRPISCMYTKCRLCADIRYRKGKLVLPKGKEAHLLIEGG